MPDGLFPNSTKGVLKKPSEIPLNLLVAFADEEMIKAAALKNQRFIERWDSIDDGTPIINDAADNLMFFLRYSPPKPSRVSHTPHSHSMILDHGNVLIFRRKFFLPTIKARPASRQISSLLISKGNL